MKSDFEEACRKYLLVATARYVQDRQAGIDVTPCLTRRLHESAAAIAANHTDQLPKNWGRQVLEGFCPLRAVELRGKNYLEFGDHPFLGTEAGKVWQHMLTQMAETCLATEETLP